jgi:hypothetical protein
MNLIQDDDLVVNECGYVVRPKKRTYDLFVIWQSPDIDNDNRDPLDIEKFLNMYFHDLRIVLVRITQHWSGFPLWRFDYYKKR